MTLLDEYQALPAEPKFDEYHFGDTWQVRVNQVERRDAVIRLLAKALRHSTTSVEVLAPLAGSAAHEYRSQAREDSALLTAVERDFPEGA